MSRQLIVVDWAGKPAAKSKSPRPKERVLAPMPDPVVLFATVILIVPMAYFLLAAPAFLLVKLDIPPVTQLMRGMFSSYFLILAIAGVIATLAFAVEGRLALAIAIALIAAFAVSARRWFLERMDAELTARDAGDRPPCANCAGCIGAACSAMRSSSSRSWPPFPISASRRPDRV